MDAFKSFACPICAKTRGEERPVTAIPLCKYCKVEMVELNEKLSSDYYHVSHLEWKKQVQAYMSTFPSFDQQLCDEHVKADEQFQRDHAFTPEQLAEIEASRRAYAESLLPQTPKCPTCGSKRLRRISGTEKVLNAAMFGIFGNKYRQQFECNDCGYRW